ncbi:3-oxoacyl-[acyl-carrier-protein] reductase FabG [Andreesenia angusta]|uniref:3-oxoacyl-[acyl-carrier-protein] reductase FabG n=1 Tax=Andreesenia angusta TaxID=39480 RepID=A0A1S1V5Y0_9FIRM|nr:SDR family oxidoreductase [Andreesenia angusta]OHW61800.1 3-oxoacyl-[acyl-carrier-protein] reductase FabG [Andreesenia angusta]
MNRKTAVVTGGSRGIGRSISENLAREGYNVVINYRNSEQNAEELKERLLSEGFSVDIFRADVSVACEAESLIEFAKMRFGGLDVLVNNAGIAEIKLFTDITDEDWDKMIRTNLNSVFYCSKHALKYMLPQKSGKIINISSIWGLIGASCEVHYSVTKAGIIALTKSLAKELGPSNIHVNCVAPGVIDTDMNGGFSEEELRDITSEIPMMKMGLPQDIAEAVLFFASDKSNFITGQVLSPNGGSVV